MQLEGVRIHEIQNVFKFRTKMTKVGGNFRGKSEVGICPLCHNHLDIQEKLVDCEILRANVKIKNDIMNVYTSDVELEVARMVSEILDTRERLLS